MTCTQRITICPTGRAVPSVDAYAMPFLGTNVGPYAILQGMRSGEAYTHVPTRRSASVAATANVGPGAGCHY